MPGGRPTKFKKEYHKSLIEAMKKGHTFTMWCLDNNVPWSTFCDWRKNNNEFSGTCKKGLKFAQAYWEKMMMATAAGKLKNGNLGAQIFWMKNRFRDDWQDKVEQDITHRHKKIKVSIGESGDIQREVEEVED